MLTSLLFVADSLLVARVLTIKTLWSPWSLYFLFTSIRIMLYGMHMPQTADFMTMLALVFQLHCTQDIVSRMWHGMKQPMWFVWIIAIGFGGLLLAVHNPYPALPPVLYYTHACMQMSMFAVVFIAMFAYEFMGGNIEKELIAQGLLWILYMAGCLVSDIIPAPVYAPLATNATGVIHLCCFAGWYMQDSYMHHRA